MRRALLVFALLLIAGGGLLLLGGRVEDTSPAETPSASVTPTPSPEPTPTGSVSLFPTAPADPTDSCGLYLAIIQSSEDLQRFGTLLLEGADVAEAARAANAYAASADDWDELVGPLLTRSPGMIPVESLPFAIKAIEWGTTVPQAADYLARVIDGSSTDRTITEAATLFADPGAYPILEAMIGYREPLCGMR